MGDLTALVRRTADELAADRAGVVVAGVRGGETAFAGAGRVGGDHAGDDVPGPDTLFEIGSITKVFTALLFARLVGRKTVALDEALADALPSGARVPERGGVHITLQHLATHRSGLPRLPKGMLLKALLKPNTPDPYAHCTADHLIGGLARTRLGAPPGRRFRYSNLGGGLLGMALAHRAGTDYETLVLREIAAPLGMVDTVVAVDAARAKRTAAGHSRTGEPVPSWRLMDLVGAGGLRSTAADLTLFARAHLAFAEEGPLDTGELADAMRLARTVDEPMRGPARVHLGWMSLPAGGPGGPRMYWHNGGTGGFSSYIGVDPAHDAAVVVLSSSSRSVDAPATDLLRGLAFDDR
ncbi:serine hydrolase domain-containing protein [Yinghuangia seranimata]|uniref:serine hydrolase domain-containing protein n=1 Tax=Yinghuangia seranimata TaxID=408067 RepID=UPI00248C7169|nr:serine hydrolase domain-containing protein [Yinghuangia seranimata]MDI2131452.1 serine hydrolase domain-containing protein [Yinghuangia seranimata]